MIFKWQSSRLWINMNMIYQEEDVSKSLLIKKKKSYLLKLDK